MSKQWFGNMNTHVAEAFVSTFDDVKDLMLPSCTPEAFILKTDWSGSFSRHMLFAILLDKKEALVDLGSMTNSKSLSPYFDELDIIVWEYKKTKAFWGSIPFIIRMDSHILFNKYKAKSWLMMMFNHSGVGVG